MAFGATWWTVLEVLLLHVWQNSGKPGRQINFIRRNELIHFSQAPRSRQRLEKGNREHRSSDGFKVQGKYILSVVEVILVDLIQLELLS